MRSISSKKAPKKIRTKFFVIGIAVAIVAIAGVMGYLFINKPAPKTPDSDVAGGATKEQIASSPVPSPTTSQDVPAQENLSAHITQLGQANGTVTIAGTITGAAQGTCVAEFTTPNDKPVTKQVAATQNDGQTTCGPIAINEVEFSYLGEWQATLKFYTPGNKKQASTEAQTITIH